jgi:predicted dehydrogenase
MTPDEPLVSSRSRERVRAAVAVGGRPRSAPLRLGIVGCGAVAERYHLPALLESTDVQPVMFVDPVLERAERLSAQVRGARAASDHRALLAQVDAAIVAVPNRWHASVASDLLRGGVHVLLEKPMARTSEECDRLEAAALAGGTTLAIGHDFRFFPVAQAAHRLLADRTFGAIVDVDVRQSAGVRWPCVSPSALNREAGGGVLLEFGVHTIDMLLWWLGDLVPTAYADDGCGGVESECECEMRDARLGIPVHVEISRRRQLRDTTIVSCEKGTIEIGLFEPALLRLRTANGGPVLDARVVDDQFDSAPLRTVFLRQLADFAAAVHTGSAPLVDADAGRRAVSLIERCYSMREPLRRSWDVPIRQLVSTEGIS